MRTDLNIIAGCAAGLFVFAILFWIVFVIVVIPLLQEIAGNSKR